MAAGHPARNEGHEETCQNRRETPELLWARESGPSLKAEGENTWKEPPEIAAGLQMRGDQSAQPGRILFIPLAQPGGEVMARRPHLPQFVVQEQVEDGLTDHLPLLIAQNRGRGRVGFEDVRCVLGLDDALWL